MSQKHVKSRHTAAKEPSKAVSALSSLNSRGNTLVIRLVLATVIFAVSLIISMPDFVGIILLVLAAAAAGSSGAAVTILLSGVITMAMGT